MLYAHTVEFHLAIKIRKLMIILEKNYGTENYYVKQSNIDPESQTWHVLLHVQIIALNF